VARPPFLFEQLLSRFRLDRLVYRNGRSFVERSVDAMVKKFGVVSLLLLGACSSPTGNSQPNVTPIESPVAAVETMVAPSPEPNPSVVETDNKYQEALTTAASAQSIGQSALSQEDWVLVTGQWQQAIERLKAVPKSSSNYSLALKLLPQYEQSMSRARQKSATFKSQTPAIKPSILVDGVEVDPSKSFAIPIVKKLEGVPIVEVIINGERCQMLLDTGASRTLITRGVKQKLALKATGSTAATTANGSANFETLLLSSVQVGEIQISNLSVAVGNDDMSYGLMGHDIYKGYDITLKEDSVIFEKR
jgi:clan AA aspartic protease (TIGR02281 family)